MSIIDVALEIELYKNCFLWVYICCTARIERYNRRFARATNASATKFCTSNRAVQRQLHKSSLHTGVSARNAHAIPPIARQAAEPKVETIVVRFSRKDAAHQYLKRRLIPASQLAPTGASSRSKPGHPNCWSSDRARSAVAE